MSYLAGYAAAVLGVLALFAPTGTAALASVAVAVLFGAVAAALIRASAPEHPRLRLA